MYGRKIAKMKIMVFDVAAEKGGALTVLRSFHKELKASADNSHFWLFVTSIVSLPETENITALEYPWIKRSWFHRLYFDIVIAPRIIREHEIDLIVSLQNTLIPRTKIHQLLFVHQMLPFSEYRIPYKEDKLAWVYQNIIKWFIFRSMRSSLHIYLQAEHFKTRCMELLGKRSSDISVIDARIDPYPSEPYLHIGDKKKVFFYPADSGYYKNHRIIIEACKLLSQDEKLNIRIVFTLDGKETKHIRSLYSQVERLSLPISFVGKLSREDVFSYYHRSILLFPSYIETVGLPLLEAKHNNCIILTSNCPFSHEALGEYSNAYYFDHTQASTLSALLNKFVAGNYTYSELPAPKSSSGDRESLLVNILKYTL